MRRVRARVRVRVKIKLEVVNDRSTMGVRRMQISTNQG